MDSRTWGHKTVVYENIILQNCPIRTKYLFDSVFSLAVVFFFLIQVQTHAQKFYNVRPDDSASALFIFMN